MKVIMSNAKNDFMLACQYYNAWKNEDIELESFFEYEINSKKILIPHKGLDFRIFKSLYRKRINKALINLAEAKKPDIILLFKSAQITPLTLSILKNKKIKLANYNPDHPYSLTGNHSTKNLEACVPYYDLYVTYSDLIKQEINKRNPSVRTEVIPFGYHEYIKAIPQPTEEINKICFIGYADKERCSVIRQLIKEKIPIDLYGPGWKKYIREDKRTKIFPTVLGEKYYETLSKYRVQLNLFRKQNIGAHNMRSFEIYRAGSIMLAPQNSDHQKFFKENTAYFNYKNNTHLVVIAKLLLEMKSDQVKAIKTKIKKENTIKDYSYNERAKSLLALLKVL